MTNYSDITNWKRYPSIVKCYSTFMIDLSNGEYTDDDMKLVAKHVMDHKESKELVLHHNDITEKGALYLAKALTYNTSLQKLNIGYNNIGDKGVENIVKPLLKGNNTLTKLHLQANAITEEGAGHLAKLLRMNSKVRKLGLDYNAIGDAGVKLLSSVLGPNSKVCEGAFSDHGAPLIALYLDSNNITDHGVDYLSEMLNVNRALTSLALGINDISDLGVDQLIQVLIEHNTRITGLNIFSNKRITDKSLDIFLKLFSQRRRFNIYKLYDCGFSEMGQEKLEKAAERIKGFDLLLEGDGFDYDQKNHSQLVRSSSNSTRVFHEEWCKKKHKYFEEKEVSLFPLVRY